MWAWMLEGCAEVVAATARGRRLPPIVAGLVVTVVALVLAVALGPRGLLPLGFLVVAVFAAARDVFVARDALWQASIRELDAPGQAPTWSGDARLTAPTAVALHRLASAVDHARRGAYGEASELVRAIDRDRLRPGELRLLAAVRAIVSTGLGDDVRAAQHAAIALPTGSDAVDATLGRLLLARAWDDPARLRVLEAAWGRAGVMLRDAGSLPELRRLTRLRIDPGTDREIDAEDATTLAAHARAIGDDGLAVELELRARPSAAYR